MKTVRVPEKFAPLFDAAQEYVSRYFADRKDDPSLARVEISGQRYMLVRAGSMSVEFFEMVKTLYNDPGDKEATSVASSILFDIAHAMGLADARVFAERMQVSDPIAKLSAGPIHFAHAGWAFVDIAEESAPSPDENYFLVYDHPYSFESDSWISAGKETNFPVCVMNAGYSSGWCESSFGVTLVATEILCRAKGDEHCRFIMAHPSHIDRRVRDYLKQNPEIAAHATRYSIPGFFARKKAEDAMRAQQVELTRANQELERRVAERTSELFEANQQLEEDLRERERAAEEHRRLEAKILQAQKLESLGVLAGGIAHDFNNLLLSVLGNASLAQRHVEPGSEVSDFLSRVETAAERAAELTRQLLAYSGQGRFQIEPLDLSGAVREMAKLLAVSVPKTVELVLDLGTQLPLIEADVAQLRQVIMNLLTNAAESIQGNGSVTLRTDLAELSRADLDLFQVAEASEPGTHVRLLVEDTGLGMDADTLSRIFDPFFTTKFSGRGLGMAAVLGIVRSHRGAIRIDSALGQGTLFTICFPALKGPSMPQKRSRTPEPSKFWRDGLVLLVDDDEPVRNAIGRMLHDFGFKVLQARDGLDGVQAFKQRHAELKLVILDLTMPRLDGVGALKQMRSVDPSVPIVLISGYSEDEASSRLPTGDVAGFLAKPFKAGDLARKLEEVLNVAAATE